MHLPSGISCLLALSLLICCACRTLARTGEAESEAHGAHSPHEKRTKDHYKSATGDHDPEFDHESILGSRHDAAEFDDMSDEDAKERLRVLVEKKMDTNQDGFIDRSELKEWIWNSLKSLDDEEVEDRFQEIDRNHDGLITLEEYIEDTFGPDFVDSEQNGGVDDEDKLLLEEDKRYFDAADQNKDGTLDKKEFAAFQNPEVHDFMSPALVTNTLAEKDLDKDGKISLDEYLGKGYREKNPEFIQSEKDRFNEFDKDGDGLLNDEEMKTWLIPDLRETAEDEVKHLFENTDQNTDGKLSVDEIVDQHELWVGSEATNYGEHLETIHEEL